MKSVAVVKTGSLRDPDESRRGKVAVRDLPVPEIGEEDVLIKVAYCAICGSDPHHIEGYTGWKVPFGLGHEISGVVVKLGKRATLKGLKAGDRVASNFLHFCGTCYFCQNGQQQFCSNLPLEGDSGMSEYAAWHQSQVYKLPDDVSLRKGCLLEPLSIAVRISDKVRIKVGERVAINGGGPIGLLTLQTLKMAGAAPIVMFEPIEERRALAKEFGADYVFNPVCQNILEESKRIMPDWIGYDAVIDCSGAASAAESLLELAAPCGTVLYGAPYPDAFILPVNLSKYCTMKELTVTGIFAAPYAYPRAMRILPGMKLDKLLVKSFPIDQIEEAFATQVSGRYPKVLIECNGDLADL
jgi:threonine dehydrogenase-like Zn-dependent dehydrogenase